MNIVILTGAGISAESGIATFRDKEGLWAQYDYRELATPEGFSANPELVHEFYNFRRKQLQTVSPNAAHIALADLESDLKNKGHALTLVTQNVDDLHLRAGSRSIYPMHGELLKISCSHCCHVMEWLEDLTIHMACPICSNTGGLRPYVVWFGEQPRFIREIDMAMSHANMFVSIGTSGSVYPAAGLVQEARSFGMETIELNLEPSDNAHQFDQGLYGPASKIVPQWVASIKSGILARISG